MIENLGAEVHTQVDDTLTNLQYEGYSLSLDILPSSSDAVLASSISFQIAQDEGKKPDEVAKEIQENLDMQQMPNIGEVSVIGPYLNFYADDEWYTELVIKSKDDEFGSDIKEMQNISVEHTSVNPTGPLHIGRVRNSILGDTLANILSYCGNSVTRDYYINDTGLQVAVLTWAYENYSCGELPSPEYDGKHYQLVRYYQKAFEDLDTDLIQDIQQGEVSIDSDYEETEVISIMKGLENSSQEVTNRVSDVVEKMLNAQVDSLEEIGIHFDNFTFESKFMSSDKLEELLKDMKNLDCAVKSDGAWMLELPDINKPFVFQRSNGTTLYGTRDVAYHIEKIEKYDKSVLVLGEDQELHAQSVKKTLELLGYNSDSIEVVHHAFVRTPDGGMSTRQGEGEFIEEVLEKSTEKALDVMKNREIDNKENIAKDITTGALRYNILSKSRRQLSVFDAENAVSVKSQTGPGIQYTYARLHSILEKTESATKQFDYNAVNRDATVELLNKISQFPLILTEVSESMKPHKLTVYTKELHELIKNFYNNCRVKNASSEQIRSNRVHTVKCGINVLGIAMELLGIPKVEKM